MNGIWGMWNSFCLSLCVGTVYAETVPVTVCTEVFIQNVHNAGAKQQQRRKTIGTNVLVVRGIVANESLKRTIFFCFDNIFWLENEITTREDH